MTLPRWIREWRARRWYAERKSDMLWASASTWLACYFAIKSKPSDFNSLSGAIKTLGDTVDIFKHAQTQCEGLTAGLIEETRKRYNLPTWTPLP